MPAEQKTACEAWCFVRRRCRPGTCLLLGTDNPSPRTESLAYAGLHPGSALYRRGDGSFAPCPICLACGVRLHVQPPSTHDRQQYYIKLWLVALQAKSTLWPIGAPWAALGLVSARGSQTSIGGRTGAPTGPSITAWRRTHKRRGTGTPRGASRAVKRTLQRSEKGGLRT